MEKDPIVLARYTKEELINYIVLSDLSPKYREMLNTVKQGDYNTRYLLGKIYDRGTVSSFIKHGITHGYLKKEWKYTGNRQKAILRPAIPSEQLVIKAKGEEEPIAQ